MRWRRCGIPARAVPRSMLYNNGAAQVRIIGACLGRTLNKGDRLNENCGRVQEDDDDGCLGLFFLSVVFFFFTLDTTIVRTHCVAKMGVGSFKSIFIFPRTTVCTVFHKNTERKENMTSMFVFHAKRNALRATTRVFYVFYENIMEIN